MKGKIKKILLNFFYIWLGINFLTFIFGLALILIGVISEINFLSTKFIIYFLTVIYIISHTFLYRFQRTTLTISRQIGDRKLQTTLTPNWITIIYWMKFILLMGLSVLIFIKFGWLWTLIFLIYSFIITPLIDIFLPIPSYKSCFVMIKRGLQKDIKKSKYEVQKLVFLQLLKAVENEEINIRE